VVHLKASRNSIAETNPSAPPDYYGGGNTGTIFTVSLVDYDRKLTINNAHASVNYATVERWPQNDDYLVWTYEVEVTATLTETITLKGEYQGDVPLLGSIIDLKYGGSASLSAVRSKIKRFVSHVYIYDPTPCGCKRSGCSCFH
jgi:hypothetical protein